MNKEEILTKSRNEKNDEGMILAENKGRKIGVSAFCAVFIVIVLFNMFNDKSNYAPFAMLWAFLVLRHCLNIISPKISHIFLPLFLVS